jgi:multidrug efflux pump subunit AcrA (membrane-fusion protein)
MGRVKAGDIIHVRFPASGQSLDARLTRVVAAQDPKTRTFSAIAELPNHDNSLRSGLYAEVTLASKTGTASTKDAGVAKDKGKKIATRSRKD